MLDSVRSKTTKNATCVWYKNMCSCIITMQNGLGHISIKKLDPWSTGIMNIRMNHKLSVRIITCRPHRYVECYGQILRSNGVTFWLASIFQSHKVCTQKEYLFLCAPRLCTTSFSMYCSTQEVHVNGVSVYICMWGVVEYHANWNVAPPEGNSGYSCTDHQHWMLIFFKP